MIQVLRGTSTQRAADTRILAAGRPFYETDTNKLYVGDGFTELKNLTVVNDVDEIAQSTFADMF